MRYRVQALDENGMVVSIRWPEEAILKETIDQYEREGWIVQVDNVSDFLGEECKPYEGDYSYKRGFEDGKTKAAEILKAISTDLRNDDCMRRFAARFCMAIKNG